LIALYLFMALVTNNQLLMSDELKPDKIKYLALGDSYTIGESVNEKDRWPNLLAKKLEDEMACAVEVTIIAKTGWTTDELMDAVDAANLREGYDLVSLLIGVNNQYRGYHVKQYKREFEGLLSQSIDLTRGDKSRVFVLSIPDYGVTPFAKDKDPKKIGVEIDRYNRIAQEICEKHEITYLDITEISRLAASDPSLIADDGLHPSGKMYKVWTEKAFSFVLSLFK